LKIHFLEKSKLEMEGWKLIKQQNMEKHLGRDCPLEGSPIFRKKLKNIFENTFLRENLNWKWKVGK